jgi:hypothetical protein
MYALRIYACVDTPRHLHVVVCFYLQATVSDVPPYQGLYAQQSRALSGILAFTLTPENLDATMASMRSA